MKRSLLFIGLLCGSLFLYWITSGFLAPSTTVLAAPELSFENAAMGSTDRCAISGNYPSEILQWCGLITQYAEKHTLDPNLIAALIWQESGGDADIISRDGAVGLMQVMPRDGQAAMFMCINGPCFADRPTTAELKDPEFNIAWGTNFLAQLQQKTGSIRDALKRYGPANVDYTYADKVLAIYANY